MLIEVNWNPNRKELRNFGLVMLVCLILVGALLAWKFESKPLFFYCGGAGVAVALISIFLPSLGRVLYKIWVGIGFCMGYVVFPFFMGVIYFLILTPIALALRLTGRDPLQRKKPTSSSYWTKITHRTDKRSYERQF